MKKTPFDISKIRAVTGKWTFNLKSAMQIYQESGIQLHATKQLFINVIKEYLNVVLT